MSFFRNRRPICTLYADRGTYWHYFSDSQEKKQWPGQMRAQVVVAFDQNITPWGMDGESHATLEGTRGVPTKIFMRFREKKNNGQAKCRRKNVAFCRNRRPTVEQGLPSMDGESCVRTVETVEGEPKILSSLKSGLYECLKHFTAHTNIPWYFFLFCKRQPCHGLYICRTPEKKKSSDMELQTYTNLAWN